MRESQGPFQGHETNPLPPQVLNLARCERELALIIYLEGAMTAQVDRGAPSSEIVQQRAQSDAPTPLRQGHPAPAKAQWVALFDRPTDSVPLHSCDYGRADANARLAASRSRLFRRLASERRRGGREGAPGEWIERDDHAAGRRIRDEHRRLSTKCRRAPDPRTFHQLQKEAGGISPARQVVRQASILEDLRLRIDEERPAASVEASL